MSNRGLIFTVIGFIACAIFIGCQNPGEKRLQAAKENANESNVDTQTDKDRYNEEWQAFKKESEIKIQLNEDRIALAKIKMEKTGAKIKASYNKEISNLEATNKELKKTLANYKNEGKNVWEDFKTGFNNAMNKLGKAVDNLIADSN